MAKRHLTQYDSSGNKQEIYLNDDEVMVGDQTLADKLSDMEDGGDGTVTGVKMNNGQPITPDDNGVVDLGSVVTDVSNKVDKVTGYGLSKNDYTDADKTAVATIPSKANDNVVVKSISVNGGQAQTPTQGNVNIVVPSMTMDDVPTAGSDNAVKSKGIKTAIDNATPTIDPTTKKWIVGGQLTNIVAEGQDGQDGNSGVASADGVESVNNLNGGTTDTAEKVYVLGANQGKRLKDQIDYVYARLQAVYAAIGNIAFWDGKPAAATILPSLDWGNPKHTVTLDLDLTNAVVKHNGEPVSGTIQVEEYTTLTLTVEAESGKALTLVESQVGTVSQDLSTVTLVMGQSNVTLDITAVAVATYSISYGTMTNCSVAQGAPTSISSSSVQIQFNVDTGYELSASGITVTNAEKSFNAATNVLTISNPTDTVTISATATVSKIKFLRGYYSSSNNIIGTGIATGGTDITSRVTVSQLLHVAPPETPLASGAAIPHMCTFGGVSSLSPSYTYSLFTIENGVRTILGSYWCSKSVKDNLSIDFTGTEKTSADVIAAYNAGTLYVRSTIFLNTQGTLLMRSDTYAGIRFGDSAFTPSTNGNNYEIVEVDETWTAEELAAFVDAFNNSTHEF